MNKKFFTTSAVFIACIGTLFNLLFPSTVEALDEATAYSAEKLKSQTSWTLEELEFFSEIANQELEDYCKKSADYRECTMFYSYDREAENDIYLAVNAFDREKILITSINPGNQTVKVIFRDEDRELERMIGIKRKEAMDVFYLARFDKGYKIYDITSSITLHTEPEAHSVFAGKASELGDGWLTPNLETELKVANLENDPNVDNILFYLMTDVGDSTNIGSYDYNSCVKSPDYQPGNECQLVYRNKKWDFVSINPNIKEDAENEVVIKDNNHNESAEENNGSSAIIDDYEKQAKELSSMQDASYSVAVGVRMGQPSSYSTTSEEVVSSSDVTLASGDIPSRDDKGEYSSLAKDEKISEDLETPNLNIHHQNDTNNPWWVLPLIAIGMAFLLIWWLIPSKKRNKKQKTLKKP